MTLKLVLSVLLLICQQVVSLRVHTLNPDQLLVDAWRKQEYLEDNPNVQAARSLVVGKQDWLRLYKGEFHVPDQLAL